MRYHCLTGHYCGCVTYSFKWAGRFRCGCGVIAVKNTPVAAYCNGGFVAFTVCVPFYHQPLTLNVVGCWF